MQSLTVASFNIHWGRHPRSYEPFDVLEACRRLDADVLALQEVWRPDHETSAAEDVADKLGYQIHEMWTGRAVMTTDIEIDGGTLTVCASHFPHLEHISPLLRWRLRGVLPDANRPAVLMGDFNMWRWVVRFIVPGWRDTVRGP